MKVQRSTVIIILLLLIAVVCIPIISPLLPETRTASESIVYETPEQEPMTYTMTVDTITETAGITEYSGQASTDDWKGKLTVSGLDADVSYGDTVVVTGVCTYENLSDRKIRIN